MNAVSLDDPPFKDDMVHKSAKHAREQRKKYKRWLDAEDPVVVANALLLIIGRALNLLKSQIAAQGEAFEQSGGCSERLMTKRLEARDKQHPTGPECPVCSTPMRQRKSAKGEFWGCSGYPDCKGTRPV